MREHPHIAAVAGTRTTNGPGELDAIELIIVAMNEAGLDHDDSVRFYAVLSSYVISFTSAQASSMLIAERDAEARWIGVTPLLHQTRRPAIVAVRDAAGVAARPRRLQHRRAGDPRRRRDAGPHASGAER